MATLLNGTTFNFVRVWGGSNPYITNTIVGYCASEQLTTAGGPNDHNTVFGYCTSFFGNVHKCNSAMGAFAMTGRMPPGSQSNAEKNVAMGYNSLTYAPDVNRNVAIGSRAMGGNGIQNGSNGNVAIGGCSMYCVNNASFNVGIGYASLKFINTGNNNIGIGYGASRYMTNNDFNIGIGLQAGANVSTGGRNIAIGHASGNNVGNQSDTISIGFNTSSGNCNGHTAIGAANSSSCNFVYSSAWTTTSDNRDKSDVEPLSNNMGLNFVRNLRPVKFNFDFRQQYVDECNFEYGTKDGTLKSTTESYGLIAQEVKSLTETLNVEFGALGFDSEKDAYRLGYDDLISPIVKSLQETINRLEILEAKV
jgi:hypothetical protein